MSILKSIEDKLSEDLSPARLEVINESSNHNVPPGRESHVKVIVVSERFAELRPVARHQHIYRLLSEELQNGLHALSLQAYTPEEWQQRGGVSSESPPCLGGSKQDG